MEYKKRAFSLLLLILLNLIACSASISPNIQIASIPEAEKFKLTVGLINNKENNHCSFYSGDKFSLINNKSISVNYGDPFINELKNVLSTIFSKVDLIDDLEKAKQYDLTIT